MAILLRKRLVRLHLRDDERSLEGVLMGFEAGHYRLANPRFLVASDQTLTLDGESGDGQRFNEAWVARDRVLFLQVVR